MKQEIDKYYKFISDKHMEIYFVLSVFYTIVWSFLTYIIIFDFDLSQKAFWITFSIIFFFPEIIIYILYDILITFNIKNKIIILILKISVNIFCFVYFVFLAMMLCGLYDNIDNKYLT